MAGGEGGDEDVGFVVFHTLVIGGIVAYLEPFFVADAYGSDVT